MNSKKRILVAPLNWGLGHATRSIPIINALIENGFEPIIASDGPPLELLKKEFPKLICLELPSYNISYPKKASRFKLKILKDSPIILKAIKKEKKEIEKIIDEYDISGIISDNRFGVKSKKIPSVFITHQLNVLSGNTSWISSKLHQRFISKFDECWVPDVEKKPNLSGKLGHIESSKFKLKYIGPISRFEKKELDNRYDLMVLLSGPEPQRTLFEDKLFVELKDFNGNILFVKGVIEKEQTCIERDNITIYNFMESQELNIAINESKLILSRSGYTTILDLTKLKKKAFFVPTPGQYEQEYLAKSLDKLGLVPFCKQKDFSMKKLAFANNYKGLAAIYHETDYKNLFSLFESK